MKKKLAYNKQINFCLSLVQNKHVIVNKLFWNTIWPHPYPREAVKLHTAENIRLGSKSKVDSTLSLTADSYSTNSVNVVADPASHSSKLVNLVAYPTSYSTNSINLVVDPTKCCDCNNAPNTPTVYTAIACDTSTGAKVANKNSDKDY